MQNAVLQMSNFHKPLRKRPSRIRKSLETILTNAETEHSINGAEMAGYTYRRKKKPQLLHHTLYKNKLQVCQRPTCNKQNINKFRRKKG